MSEKTLVETLKKDRIKIGAYTPILHFDEEHVKLLAEAGVDYAIFRIDNVDPIPEEHHENLVKWFEKYGVEFSIHCEKYEFQYEGADMLDLSKKDELFFKDSPAFASYCYVDEPGWMHFDVLGEEIRKFKKEFPGKEAYVNLLPMYSSAKQLAKGPWKTKIEYFDEGPGAYKRYLDEFVEKVDVNHIGVDIYPCRRRPKKECPEMFPAEYEGFTYDRYLRSIEIVADKCRESGREFWVCLQTSCWGTDVREITPAELRWQAYTMLSFGAKALIYFVFASRRSLTGCMLNPRGETTKLFYASKKMCEGIKKLSDLYMEHDNLGAFAVNYDEEKTPYLYMKNPYDMEKFGVISDIESNTPLLIGCFEKKDGKGKAFTIVNQQDWSEPMDSVIKMKIDGKVTVYYDGEPTVMTANNGVYEFNIAQGDGIFVTVE